MKKPITIKIRLTATPMIKVMRPSRTEDLVVDIVSVAACLIEVALTGSTEQGGLDAFQQYFLLSAPL